MRVCLGRFYQKSEHGLVHRGPLVVWCLHVCVCPSVFGSWASDSSAELCVGGVWRGTRALAASSLGLLVLLH